MTLNSLQLFKRGLLLALLPLELWAAAVVVPTGDLCRHVVADLVHRQSPWFEVVVPTQDGFEYHKVRRKKEVKALLKEKSPEMEAYVDELFEKAQDYYKDILKVLRPVAHQFGAKLEYRIKDAESLREKIIDRARAYHEQGKIFSPDDLYDLIGTRLIVPTNSHLLALGSSREVWAKYLNLKPEQIVDIEMKGRQEECAKGRCYRATHVAVLHESGVRWEIQVMSRNMNYWAKWDHPTVYKREGVLPVYRERLKLYSRFWVKLIRALEDNRILQKSSDKVESVLNELDIEIDIHSRDWLTKLDLILQSKIGIRSEDGFLIYLGPTALSELKALSRF